MAVSPQDILVKKESRDTESEARSVRTMAGEVLFFLAGLPNHDLTFTSFTSFTASAAAAVLGNSCDVSSPAELDSVSRS
jgi:hypothetical protein